MNPLLVSRRSLLRLTAAAMLWPILLGGGQAPAAGLPGYGKIEYRIPMRDGVRLYTAVYVPLAKPGTHPILMERTPYGAGPYGPNEMRQGHNGSSRFVENSYIFAYQDVRGKGQSEGKFENIRPLLGGSPGPQDADESTDTWDTVDYLVKHVPDNNGRVGIWGISYPGYYAALGAVRGHPALRVASPQAPVSDWFLGDDFHHHGALFLMDAVSFARFGETPDSARPAAPAIDFGGDATSFFLQNGTLAGITEKYFPGTDGVWNDVMQHPNYDGYWQVRSLPKAMQKVTCPTLVVGGWFDAEDCWGALKTGRATVTQNPAYASTLCMGPWYHGMWADGGGSTFGGMRFGVDTSTYYQEKVEFPFIDACLRGSGRPELPAAVVFETGANRWREFRQWPPANLRETALRLLPGGALGVGAGPTASGSEFDEYVSDPAAPVPYQAGRITSRTREYMVDDQRFAASRKDVLSYRSEPLTRPLTIAGPLTADLYVSVSGTDADFIVKVIDVLPEDGSGGYQNLLRGDVFRARFRSSYSKPEAMKPNEVTRLKFEMPDLLHTFQPGHRIMVQVQSTWFPLVDRNPQTFVDIHKARPEDFKKATIRVYHTPERPSSVRVGVL
jgi:putative CocE/NonD family hydrolase